MNIDKRRAELLKHTQEQLANMIINRELNDFVGHYADYNEDDVDTRNHGKRVPYIGWYWRSVSFAEGYITIGDCGDFIGFMENNKWGYPQRQLDEEETKKILDIICEAYRLNNEGGILSDIIATAKAKLEEVWPLMQTFPITRKEGWWIYGPQGRVAYAETLGEADGLIVSLQEAAQGLIYRKERA